MQDPDRVLAASPNGCSPSSGFQKGPGYISDPRSFVGPSEDAWLDQIESQVTRFGFDEKGGHPQPLEAEILSALFGPSTSSNVALLLAEFGEGKSFFTVSLCVHLQDRYLATPRIRSSGTGPAAAARLQARLLSY